MRCFILGKTKPGVSFEVAFATLNNSVKCFLCISFSFYPLDYLAHSTPCVLFSIEAAFRAGEVAAAEGMQLVQPKHLEQILAQLVRWMENEP